jgi:hypothetical protein
LELRTLALTVTASVWPDSHPGAWLRKGSHWLNFVDYFQIFNKFNQNIPNWGCSRELFFLKIERITKIDFDASEHPSRTLPSSNWKS